MLADVYSVHNPGANEDLAPTTSASKRPAEDCVAPLPKVRALSELRGEDTPPGFRIASNGNTIPVGVHTSSHSAEREYFVDGRVVWGPDDLAPTVSSFDPDAIPGTPPCESDDESDDEDGEDGPGGHTVLVPETPPASPRSPGSPGSPGIVVPESPLN
eukprot:1382059-Prymnesium_polylepis.1